MPRPRILSLPERLDAHPDFAGRGVAIAFVDAGFFAHPDLMRPSRRVRAFVDVTREVPHPSAFFVAHPRAWHGTMTACAAAGNGYRSGGRYRGLASEADVVLVKAQSDDGRILGKHVAAAMRIALRHPELHVRIVNVSLGVEPDDPHAHDVDEAARELEAAGIAVFAAAGNNPNAAPQPPGSSKHAITVGGGNNQNTMASDDDTPWPSSHGNGKPDLLAPAIWLPAPMLPGTLVAREAAALFHLLSVLEEVTAEQGYRAEAGAEEEARANARAECDATNAFVAAVEARLERGKYIAPETQHVDGTSFASPIVAGVAAQMLEAAPSLAPAALREGLLATAVPLPGIEPELQGAGVLRARAAVEWALSRAR